MKELKKKHSSRPVGGAETGSPDREDAYQGSGWWLRQLRQQLADLAVPHLHAHKLGGTNGEQDRRCNPGF